MSDEFEVTPELYHQAFALVSFVSKFIRDFGKLVTMHKHWAEEEAVKHGGPRHVWGCGECVKALVAKLTPAELTEARHCSLCMKRAQEAFGSREAPPE